MATTTIQEKDTRRDKSDDNGNYNNSNGDTNCSNDSHDSSSNFVDINGIDNSNNNSNNDNKVNDNIQQRTTIDDIHIQSQLLTQECSSSNSPSYSPSIDGAEVGLLTQECNRSDDINDNNDNNDNYHDDNDNNDNNTVVARPITENHENEINEITSTTIRAEGEGEGERGGGKGAERGGTDAAMDITACVDIMTRVANNKRRNEQRLIDLGLASSSTTALQQRPTGEKKDDAHDEDAILKNDKDNKEHSSSDESPTNTTPTCRRGMIFPTKYNQHLFEDQNEYEYQYQELDENLPLEEIYPHREKQIRLLHSCFHATIRQACNSSQSYYSQSQPHYNNNDAIYIPPPMFVTGVGGTGKTCIVRDVLHRLQYGLCEQNEQRQQQQQQQRCHSNSQNETKIDTTTKAGVAYINCTTIGTNVNSINTILQDVYRQLVYDFEVRSFSKRQQHFEGSRDKKQKRTNNKNSFSNGSATLHSNAKETDKQANIRRLIENEYTNNLENILNNEYHAEDGEDSHSHDYDNQNQNSDEEDWIEMKKKHHLKNPKKRKNAPVGSSTSTSSSSRSRIESNNISNSANKAKKQKSNGNTCTQRRSGRLHQASLYNNTSNQSSTSSTNSSPKRSSIGMMTNKLNTNIGKLHTPMAFGRAITKYCGTTKYGTMYHHCGFLVLDHAEKLLSIDGSHGPRQNLNLLSQLLLLPKVMNLNLTIVVITNKMLLEHTRINNINAQHHKMFGSIAEAISPIRCHFNAYKGRGVFRDILMTPRLRQLILGESEEDEERSMSMLVQLYKTLTGILIQSVESTTRDVREMLRLLRIIWPFYLKPLVNDENDELLEECFPGDSDNDDFVLSGKVIEILGQKVRPYLRRMLNECLLRPGQTLHMDINDGQMSEQSQKDNNHDHRTSTFAQGLPYNSKFLLLAAYLCQSNKSEYDRKLYTNKASGKRKRNKKNQQNATSVENITHASSSKAQQNLRTERIPSFPLERMLSIFSSIYSKYAQGLPGSKTSVDDLGSISLFANIAELRQLGFLSCMNTTQDANRSYYSTPAPFTKYTCNLSREEADSISSQLNFPLKDYLAEYFHF